MKMKIILIPLLFLFSCENRTVKYAGMNDLVFGVHQIVLYDNNEFYLELGLGGVEGKYSISDDSVVNLVYDDKSDNWPDQLIMTKEYFETVENDPHIRTLRIKRGR